MKQLLILTAMLLLTLWWLKKRVARPKACAACSRENRKEAGGAHKLLDVEKQAAQIKRRRAKKTMQ